jgi:gliding motility-associated-like protein
MANRWLLPIILLMFSIYVRADTPVHIRRICEDTRNNHLYFDPSDDTCSSYFQYKIWGRNGNSGPFLLLDSIDIRTQNEYIHVDASPGIATNWSYFIVITDSCGPTYETISDTIPVDRQQPTIIFLDSVSVNPLSNEPYLGWKHNPSSDFSHFKVYSIESTNTLISPLQKDTFFRYPVAVNGPKSFNISSVDSCGNETPFIIGKHTTMFLSSTSDTCKKETYLSWTPYIGWSAIRIYYIFISKNGGEYILTDSVFPPISSYTYSIELGSSYSYYIRAYKEGDEISSSSNGILNSTRFRTEPENSYVTAVSILKPNDPLTEIHIFNPGEEAQKYSVQASETVSGVFSEIGTISITNSSPQYYSLQTPFVPSQKYYRAIAQNRCGIDYPSTNIARYTLLTTTQQGNTNQLEWESYFTWNVGVDHYNIYRGTNDINGNIVFGLLDVVANTDTTYLDQDLPTIVGENGLCYYIEAVQQSGDINPSLETCLSTMSCIVGELKVYIPNAFNPNGVNTFFRPEGSYIDYTHSQLKIYDRWGREVIRLNGIRSGWDGKDSDGKLCMQGVYLYQLFIVSTNGQTQNFKGTVTLLD